MGYNAHAVGVVGLHFGPGVIAAKLHTEEKVRGCKHIMRDDAKFCPECGAKAFNVIDKPIKEYDEDDEEHKLCGYTLLARSSEDYDDPEYIAYHWTDYRKVKQSRTFPMNMLQRLPAIQEEMQKKLQSLGLFNKKAFGVHVFLYEDI